MAINYWQSHEVCRGTRLYLEAELCTVRGRLNNYGVLKKKPSSKLNGLIFWQSHEVCRGTRLYLEAELRTVRGRLNNYGVLKKKPSSKLNGH